MSDVRIDIIIPAYNEERRIARTVQEYAHFFPESVRFIIVLNHCSDNTLTVVLGLQKQFPGRIDYLNIPEAVGKGGAIIRGWELSTAAIIGFTDADGATSAEEFKKIIDALPGNDGVIASRFLPGAHILERTSWLRTVISRGTIWLVHLLFRMPYSDTQCGAKLFRHEVIKPILPKLRTTNMLFDIELLWLLYLRGCRLVEIPTIWVDQPGSASLGSNLKFLKTAFTLLGHLLRLRLNKNYYSS